MCVFNRDCVAISSYQVIRLMQLKMTHGWSQVNLLGNPVTVPKFLRNYKIYHSVLFIKFYSYLSDRLNLDLNFL